MRNRMFAFLFTLLAFLPAIPTFAQTATGSIDVTARITPTGARPEPVRQFTIYILTKSYAEILNEVGSQSPLPSKTEFIQSLKSSPELKQWMKDHDTIDLAAPDIDKLLTVDDIMNVPEFFSAYQRWNGGGVTAGLPQPKAKESDRDANPDKYDKQKQEYLAATKKFIQTHGSTVSGMETELAAVNPKYNWDKLNAEHTKKIAQLGPDVAQTKYLAAKAETDLEGHLVVSGLAPGTYWLSSLGMDAASGDRRLAWDVPVKVDAGKTARADLTNVNGIDVTVGKP